MSLKLEQREGLPEGWKQVPLRDVCRLGGGKTPRKSTDEYWSGDILWASPKDFNGPYLSETEDKLSNKGLRETSMSTYESGDIALVVRSGVLKHTLPVAQLQHPATVNQDVKVLQPDTDIVISDYLHSILLYESPRIRTSCAKTGTTVESIETSFLKAYKIPIPPLPEQRRIVEVLSTVDEQIRQTNEIVEKTAELKTALVQRLIDEGIGDEKKASAKVGPLSIKIPKSWQVRRLDTLPSSASEVVQTGPYGSKLSKSEFTNSGYKIYRQANINAGDFDRGEQYVTGSKYDELAKYQIDSGDVLLTRMGTVGDTAVLPEEAEKGVMDYHLFRIRVDSSVCLPDYLAEVLRSSRIVKHQIQSFSHGAIMDGLNTSLINELRVPIPPVEVQRTISNILSSIDETNLIEEQRHAQLKELKRGLMQDLLTGTVRVPESIEAGD